MADRIALHGLSARGRHGWSAGEREASQAFRVDVVLGVDTHSAAATDDLAHTVDYGDVAGRVVGIIAGEPVKLIETLAQRIADTCLTYTGVQDVEVTVHKPEAPVSVPFDDVTVTIRRART